MRSDTAATRSPLRPAALRRALVVPGGVWTEVRVVAETGSTNADVAVAARAGEPEGLVVIAERQSAGRGRLGRRWEAPARAGITMSVLLRPRVPASRLAWLPLLAGVAVVEAVRPLAAVDAVVKWPNDLLVRPIGSQEPYGKCAGILAEAVPDAVVLGIGLNVSQRADELAAPVDRAALRPTSLALAGSAVTDRPRLVQAILSRVAEHYRRWCAVDGDPQRSGLAAAYRAACVTIGRDVIVTLPGGGRVGGRACDVDGDGRLVVATPAGTHALAAGDVYHVR